MAEVTFVSKDGSDELVLDKAGDDGYAGLVQAYRKHYEESLAKYTGIETHITAQEAGEEDRMYWLAVLRSLAEMSGKRSLVRICEGTKRRGADTERTQNSASYADYKDLCGG